MKRQMKAKSAKKIEVKTDDLTQEEQARREFLKKAGQFAVVTPPSIALLLGTSLNSQAIAASHGGRGWGKPGWGKPGWPGGGKKAGGKKALRLGRLARKLG